MIDFSSEIKEFISNDMCVDIDDLEKIIKEKSGKRIPLFIEYIEYLKKIEPYKAFTSDDDYENSENSEIRDDLNTKIIQFLEDRGIIEETDEYYLADTLRHAFVNFKEGGLLGLYQGREAENWYPKVIVKTYLGERNTVLDLNHVVTIFRGTSSDEFKSKQFSQSWTVDKSVALAFAFEHYECHMNYENTDRVILESEIERENIYYYDQSGTEKEVIINVEKLISKPKIIDQRAI